MQHQLRLKDSPIALESRYQLWKLNPNHPWLQHYMDDVQRWNRGTYYRSYDSLNDNNDASLDHNKYIKQHIKKHIDDYYYDENNNDNENEMDGNDFETLQTRKREKFYENRRKLGEDSNSNYSLSHETQDDHLFDYERQNKAKRNFNTNKSADHSQRDFFDSDGFDEDIQDTTMSWGQ